MHKTWAFLDLPPGLPTLVWCLICQWVGVSQQKQNHWCCSVMQTRHGTVFDILKNHVRAFQLPALSSSLHSPSHSHIYLDKENLKYLLCLWPLTSQYSFQDSCWVERNPPFIWVYERNFVIYPGKKLEYCHRSCTGGIKQAAGQLRMSKLVVNTFNVMVLIGQSGS